MNIQRSEGSPGDQGNSELDRRGDLLHKHIAGHLEDDVAHVEKGDNSAELVGAELQIFSHARGFGKSDVTTILR